MAEETKSLGKYEIVSELGRGGMGVVFKAWEESLQRFVAIKMLGDQLTNDENLVARFLREARSVADLNHPNIVQVFAVDTHEGRPYFAMEFVEGESLTELIRTSRKVEPERALTLLKEVASGLSAAHDKGVVHRDIKPDNIMLTRHGGVKVVDFGVARVDDPNTRLTATGMAVGTPNYISPEVCLGMEVDKRSDLFSMGIVFYEMLTGETPFNADSPLEMMTNVVKAEVPDITKLNPAIDQGLRAILYHLLEKNPDYRYQDFHEVIADIEAYRAGKSLPFAARASSQPTMKVDTGEVARVAGQAQSDASPASGSRVPLAAGLIAVALLAGAGGWYFFAPGEAPQPVADDGAPVIDPNASTAAADGADTEDTATDSETDESAGQVADTGAADDRQGDPAPVAGDDSAEQLADAAPSGDAAPPAGDAAAPEKSAAAASRPELPFAPDYTDPQLVVVVDGDPAVAGAFEAALEGALTGENYAVLNEHFFDGFRQGADIATLGKITTSNGGDVVVVGSIRTTGSRDLEYYGRREQLTVATLQVTAMLPAERRNLGTPWQSSLEYTAANAAEKSRDAATPIARELIERLNALKASQQ